MLVWCMAAYVTNVQSTCPCVPQSLCRSLSPQPPPRPEVVAYHGATVPKKRNAWSGAGLFNNGSSWRNYDWTKVTTIGLFAELDGDEGYELLCTAHKHGVRVLPWSGPAFGHANPIAALYDEYRYKYKDTVAVFHNKTAVDANAAASVKFVVENGFDGILLDAEGLSALTPATTLQLRGDLVHWVAKLRSELNIALPGSLLTWTTDQNATHGNDTVYSFADLGKYVDFFQPMEYCNAGAVPMPNSLPHRIRYSSRSNDPIWALTQTVQDYARFGIGPEQIVMLLPWFGADFRCLGSQNCSRVAWVPHDPTWWGGQCGQAVDGGPGYSQALNIYHNRSSIGHSTGPLLWDSDSATNYFTWVNSTPGTAGNTSRHQLWFDDPRSFGLKVAKVHALGLRGIGMWLPEVATSPTDAAAMWAAVHRTY